MTTSTPETVPPEIELLARQYEDHARHLRNLAQSPDALANPTCPFCQGDRALGQAADDELISAIKRLVIMQDPKEFGEYPDRPDWVAVEYANSAIDIRSLLNELRELGFRFQRQTL